MSKAKKQAAKPFRLSDLQKKVLEGYEDGDFAYLGGMEWKSYDEFIDFMKGVGDGLLTFVLVEMQDLDEDAAEEAMNRIARSLDQLNDVFGALAAMNREQTARAPGA
ncbi:hypothetical protein ACVIGB_000931 [Bradyrhizobium sp. USDA 4341]